MNIISLKNLHKQIITHILFITIAVFGMAKIASAQGLYHCTWHPVNGCYVDTSTSSCQSGFDDNDDVCESITNENDCARRINNTCEELYPQSGYKCPSSATGCQPCGPNELGCVFEDISSCNSACQPSLSNPPSQYWRCTPSNGCQQTLSCNPTTSPTCYTSAQACEASCSAPAGITAPQNKSARRGDPLDPTDGCQGKKAIYTALGCIPFETDKFVPALLRFIIGFAGLAALVIMIIGSIVVITGGSNPEQVQKGKELFTSAIVGLLFIIFSVVILRIVAADIIQLPQFVGN